MLLHLLCFELLHKRNQLPGFPLRPLIQLLLQLLDAELSTMPGGNGIPMPGQQLLGPGLVGLRFSGVLPGLGFGCSCLLFLVFVQLCVDAAGTAWDVQLPMIEWRGRGSLCCYLPCFSLRLASRCRLWSLSFSPRYASVFVSSWRACEDVGLLLALAFLSFDSCTGVLQ